MIKGADCLELVRLHRVGDRNPPHAPGSSPFLESGVIELAVGLKDPVESARLLPIGFEAITVAAFHHLPAQAGSSQQEVFL